MTRRIPGTSRAADGKAPMQRVAMVRRTPAAMRQRSAGTAITLDRALAVEAGETARPVRADGGVKEAVAAGAAGTSVVVVVVAGDSGAAVLRSSSGSRRLSNKVGGSEMLQFKIGRASCRERG